MNLTVNFALSDPPAEIQPVDSIDSALKDPWLRTQLKHTGLQTVETLRSLS